MRKLMVLAATMALMLAAAAPAFAQTDFQNTYIDGTRAEQYLDAGLAEEYLDDDYEPIKYPTGNVFINNWR